MFCQKEWSTPERLYRFVSAHPNAYFEFQYSNGDKIKATFDTAFESDNDLEIDDPNCEEFISLVFLNLDTETLFEAHDLNFPYAIFSGGEKTL